MKAKFDIPPPLLHVPVGTYVLQQLVPQEDPQEFVILLPPFTL